MPRTGSSAGDWIELRPGVIRSLFGSSHASHGDVPLDPPNAPIRVDAHLVGPNVVGACDDAMFTASSSTGAGGRRLTYRFKVTSENDVSKASARIRAMNASDSELRLDVHDLEPGGVYIVTVQVTNFLGDTSTASVTATKSAAPAPVVAIDGAKIIQTTAGAPLRLSAQARLPSGSCLGQSIEDKVGTRIAYTWTLVEGPSLDFGAGTLAKTSSSPTLFVEPRTLEFGSTYVFRVEARLAADTFHRSHDTVTVVVGVDSIDDPIVLGPSSSPSGSGLELVALNRDPMLPDDSSEYPWTHRWECVVFRGYDDVTGESCPEAIDAHLFVDADRVVVPGGDPDGGRNGREVSVYVRRGEGADGSRRFRRRFQSASESRSRSRCSCPRRPRSGPAPGSRPGHRTWCRRRSSFRCTATLWERTPKRFPSGGPSSVKERTRSSACWTHPWVTTTRKRSSSRPGA